jgi:hypothetical protein
MPNNNNNNNNNNNLTAYLEILLLCLTLLQLTSGKFQD